jgi:hypothetical protein
MVTHLAATGSAQNVVRASQMHSARLAPETQRRKPDAAAKLWDFRVGWSGWSYRHWRGRFYPAGSKTSAGFTHGACL